MSETRELTVYTDNPDLLRLSAAIGGWDVVAVVKPTSAREGADRDMHPARYLRVVSADGDSPAPKSNRGTDSGD